jgi:predicted AAA+ superfamily ATPase
VARLSQLITRIDRILELAERWLERRTGARLEPALAARCTAFRWEARDGAGRLLPIEEMQATDLDDLLGVERSIAELVRNTAQFVRGLPANHVLLFGERGTGKSSSVKGCSALRGARAAPGRSAEERSRPAPDVVAALRGLPYRFLVFCDDLSFDDGEPGMRELKVALEGSVETTPGNVRIIATSNRRHLVPEFASENRAARLDDDGELHVGEALEEKLALADRFGLVLGFYGFDQPTYLRIVDRYAQKAGIDWPRDQLHAEALRFALQRASRSGRVARHFVDDLAGRLALERAGGS